MKVSIPKPDLDAAFSWLGDAKYVPPERDAAGKITRSAHFVAKQTGVTLRAYLYAAAGRLGLRVPLKEIRTAGLPGGGGVVWGLLCAQLEKSREKIQDKVQWVQEGDDGLIYVTLDTIRELVPYGELTGIHTDDTGIQLDFRIHTKQPA
jgi:hypothetical protein